VEKGGIKLSSTFINFGVDNSETGYVIFNPSGAGKDFLPNTGIYQKSRMHLAVESVLS